jgi:hypothetical protein
MILFLIPLWKSQENGALCEGFFGEEEGSKQTQRKGSREKSEFVG